MTTLAERLEEVEAMPDARAEALVLDLSEAMNFVSVENKAAAYMAQAMLAQEYPHRDILRLWFQFMDLVPPSGIGGF